MLVRSSCCPHIPNLSQKSAQIRTHTSGFATAVPSTKKDSSMTPRIALKKGTQCQACTHQLSVEADLVESENDITDHSEGEHKMSGKYASLLRMSGLGTTQAIVRHVRLTFQSVWTRHISSKCQTSTPHISECLD